MKFAKIKNGLILSALTLSSIFFMSCGGGSSSTTTRDYIPVGTTLNMFMGEYALSVYVTADNYAYMLWDSKYPQASGYATFTFVDQGNNVSQFQTTFTYDEGAFIEPGPVITVTWVKVGITANLTMPENMSSDAYGSAFNGTSEWTIYMRSSANSVEPNGTFTGSGIYNFQPTQ